MQYYWLLKQVTYIVRFQIIITLTLSVILRFKVRSLGDKNNTNHQSFPASNDCIRTLTETAEVCTTARCPKQASVFSDHTHVKQSALSSGSISGVLQKLTVAKPFKKWNVYYRVHRTAPVAPSLSQPNPVHRHPHYLFTFNFNIILSSMPRSSK
jgi:hypothetical protein